VADETTDYPICASTAAATGPLRGTRNDGSALALPCDVEPGPALDNLKVRRSRDSDSYARCRRAPRSGDLLVGREHRTVSQNARRDRGARAPPHAPLAVPRYR
jgi:hypothetical protein